MNDLCVAVPVPPSVPSALSSSSALSSPRGSGQSHNLMTSASSPSFSSSSSSPSLPSSLKSNQRDNSVQQHMTRKQVHFEDSPTSHDINYHDPNLISTSTSSTTSSPTSSVFQITPEFNASNYSHQHQHQHQQISVYKVPNQLANSNKILSKFQNRYVR